MFCHNAMITPVASVSENEMVSVALKALASSQIGLLPVVDDNGALVGTFSLGSVLRNVMPVSVPVTGGFMPDVQLPAAPGMARRLEKIIMAQVHDVMDRKTHALAPEAALTDAVHLLLSGGHMAVMVVDPDSKKPIGAVTTASAYAEIERMKDSK